MNCASRPYKGKSLLVFPDDYCVIDIETNGFGPYLEILELSAVRFRGGALQDSFSTLVKPSRKIYPFISALTGITDEMAQCGAQLVPSLERFSNFIGDDILLGYNVNFDINIIYDNMLARLGKPLSNDFVDILRFARKTLPDLADHKQTTVASYFGVSTDGAHRAEADCLICDQCFKYLSRILTKR